MRLWVSFPTLKKKKEEGTKKLSRPMFSFVKNFCLT
jgi:hypothetical protein